MWQKKAYKVGVTGPPGEAPRAFFAINSLLVDGTNQFAIDDQCRTGIMIVNNSQNDHNAIQFSESV